MQGTMSKNLCEAWVKRRVRDTSQSPRWLAYLWLDMATPRWCEEESVLGVFCISPHLYQLKRLED